MEGTIRKDNDLSYLKDILDKHYFSNQKSEVESCLSKLGLLESVENCLELLNSNAHSNGTLAAELLHEINSSLRANSDTIDKAKCEFILVDLFRRIMLDMVESNEKFAGEFPDIVESIKTVCVLKNYDFKVLDKMVGLSVLQEDLKKSSTPKFSARTELNKVKKLSWSGAKPLMLFSQKLKENSYISDPKTFELLFKDSDEDYLVEIKKNKARHISYMINRLNNSEPRVISPVGGRGYFSFIEERIVYDSSGRVSKNYMKKTAYRIKQEKERNEDLIKEVEDLIEEFIPNKRTIDGR